MDTQTTTSRFQILPDFFDSPEKCLESEKMHIVTNSRYNNYDQIHFTAGDVDQFEEFRDYSNGQLCIPRVDLSRNIFDKHTFQYLDFSKYKDLTAVSVNNTFSYLFYKFKKGLFVKVTNAKMNVFLPFSNRVFLNEWSSKIRIDPEYENVTEFIRHVNSLENRPFNPKRVGRNPTLWYANNCLIRFEYPLKEGDTNDAVISDMLKTLCVERKIPDIEVFINRRDFPLLKKDATEPYNHLYDSENFSLLSHNYEKFCPILSMVTKENYADIPIPTAEDWVRVMRKEGKFFRRTCTRSFEIIPNAWEKRKPIAVFRGKTTGCGVTIDTNPRLKAAYISSKNLKDEDELPFLDAGIIAWNLRPRKIQGEKYLKTIEIENLPFGLVGWLSPQEQAEYKYVLHIDGHVAAFRLSLELESGACILKIDSPYKVWYSFLLKPYKHYIPVKRDLSDLIEKIKWCKRHDKECKKIAENAQIFAKKYLTKKGILDYLQKRFFELKKVTGTYLYNSTSLLDLQYSSQLDFLKVYEEKLETKISTLYEFPGQSRNLGLNQAIQRIVYSIDLPDEKGAILYENKNTTIQDYTIAGKTIVRKTPFGEARNRTMVNEAFASMFCTNNLLNNVPNFAYVYGIKNFQIYMEKIEGRTLQDCISKKISSCDLLLIFVQISLALQVAQNIYGFVHYDVTPWNIIVMKNEVPAKYDYVIREKVYTVESWYCPVLIDMERAHVIYKGNHYGTVNRFEVKTAQDVITLLITSMYLITQEYRNLSVKNEDLENFIFACNFLSGTTFRERPFRATGRNGLGDIAFFMEREHWYSSLLHGSKYELEKKTPLDFVGYLIPKVKNVKISNVRKNFLFLGNCKQVLKYVTAKNTEKRLKTYSKVLQRILNCTIELKNVFENVCVAQELFRVASDMNFFYRIETGEDLETYDKVVTKLQNMIKHSSDLEIKISLQNPETETYSEFTFLEPKVILKLLEKNSDFKLDIDSELDNIEYYKDLEFILVNEPRLGLTLKDEYKKDIPRLNYTQSLIACANLLSLRKISALVYSNNLAVLRGSDFVACKEIEKILETYKKIKKILKNV